MELDLHGYKYLYILGRFDNFQNDICDYQGIIWLYEEFWGLDSFDTGAFNFFYEDVIWLMRNWLEELLDRIFYDDLIKLYENFETLTFFNRGAFAQQFFIKT